MPEKKDVIDTFERYANTLVRLYREALEDNLSLTDTIRTEYDSSLQHKDAIIQELKEQINTCLPESHILFLFFNKHGQGVNQRNYTN